jgi:hypothetical protein
MEAQMKKSINEANRSITFTFDGLDAVVFQMAKCSAENNAYAPLHGYQARIGDNAAISRKDPKTGVVKTITEFDRRNAVIEMVDHLHSGSKEWNLRGTSVRSLNPIWLAMAQKRGVEYDVIAAEKAEADLAELAAMEAPEQTA